MITSIINFLFFINSAIAADIFPIAKVEEFVAKKKPCDLAVAHVIKAEDQRYPFCGKTDCLVGDMIYCVGDGVVGQGTIKERKGCMLSGYYLNSDRIGKLNGIYVLAEGKTCSSGGFEELLKKEYGATPSVKDLLTKSIGGMTKPVVLPSRDSKMVDFIRKAIQSNK